MAALLESPGEVGVKCLLCGYNDGFVVVNAADGSVLFFFATAPAAAPPEQLREVFTANLKAHDRRELELHFVAVGGGIEVADLLRQSIPPGYSPRLVLHHIDAAGKLTRIHTQGAPRRLSVLDEAMGRTQVTPLTPARVEAALAEIGTIAQLSGGLYACYLVTAAITLVCVVLMGLEYWWMGAGELAVFAAMGGNSPDAALAGEVWRLFASAFLHGNIVHLLVNMFALWSFGVVLESLLGWRRYLILYAVSALGGSLASAFLGSAVVSVGASGAIWGLMAAGLGIAYWPRGLLPPPVVETMRKKAWMPLLMNLAYSFQPGIDILAHLGGGLVGFALCAGLLTRGLKPLAERRYYGDAERTSGGAVTVGAAALTLAMALSVAVALVTGRPWELDDPLVFQRTPLGDTGITLELPVQLLAGASVETQNNLTIFGFGNFPRTPVAFEFVIAGLPKEPGPDELDAFFKQRQMVADVLSPPEFERLAPARQVTVAGRRSVVVEHRKNDLSLRTHIFLVGRHEFLMRRFSLGDPPPNWVAVEHTIAASLPP